MIKDVSPSVCLFWFVIRYVSLMLGVLLSSKKKIKLCSTDMKAERKNLFINISNHWLINFFYQFFFWVSKKDRLHMSQNRRIQIRDTIRVAFPLCNQANPTKKFFWTGTRDWSWLLLEEFFLLSFKVICYTRNR